jgi:hypothetical protein
MVQASGLEVVMKLRDRGEAVPIILMIGPRKEPDRVETFAFTYRVHVLRKPFGVAELRDAVDRALGSAGPIRGQFRGQVDFHFLVVSQQAELRGLADGVLGQDAMEVVDAVHPHGSERDEDVAFADAGAERGAVGLDALDQDAAVAGEAVEEEHARWRVTFWPPMPIQPRRMTPSRMSRWATNLAVSDGIAKQMPWAGRMTAVLTPMISPRELTSGPPELPGLRAASVWMMLSIRRPDCERRERPSALTTPAVRVHWKPYGLPIATTIWPARRAPDSPRGAAVRSGARMRTTARSVCGSSPIRAPWNRRPPVRVTSMSAAPWTTWLLVRMKPSGVKRKPDPPPRPCRPERRGRLHLDGDDRRADFLGDLDDGLGVSVQQAAVRGWG